ncbi:MAG: GTP 3',8-cyclase MoaA [Planctomycetes bacterium]|nr:GTP 3',8-cyclase MoaA [Planctomycetota bacterium]
MILITEKPIETAKLLEQAQSPEAGAVVLFLGTTRQITDGRETACLKYEAYPSMATKELERLEEEARQRWPLTACLIAHRLGTVPLGEASVAIVVASAHRREAFAAGEWLIDTLKVRVPIWKQEQWADGETEWVHPTPTPPLAVSQPLTDPQGRIHTNLRISVTDRCNIRCFYCMPAEKVTFRPREELLTFEEIEQFVRIAATLGINRVRLTGGEPLVRSELPKLVSRLAGIPGIEDLALTTNGLLLAEQATDLKSAGLNRLNISLDTLDEKIFQEISRRPGLDQVLKGIFAAKQAGFEKIRLNAIAIRGLTEHEIVPLALFARKHDLELRFIEFMPLDADHAWKEEKVLSGESMRRILEKAIGPLEPVQRNDPSQPAVDYQFADGKGRIGFINPVSEPFCDKCNRLRLTAEGQVQNCLFSSEGWDARALLRGNATDADLCQLVRDCVAAKQPAHGIGEVDFQQPPRAMYQIGG